MNISVHKLFQKMEDELKQAKMSSSERTVRERVHAIKALCELILEDSSSQERYRPTSPSPVVSAPEPQPISIQQGKKLTTDDGSNGDSLFDF
ncbi:YwdI family protein [Cytobacillus spongiae]|uniref:YwdI family protein n=1 Tax=Cytobacillus spongiae TaxID=2901381 RepID=UPI001F2B15A7|nr:YwdI family protein [Cytobacillus spongiae]UII55799.1 YwdI family protein [Cytobacillus spongiae]